MSGNGLKNIGLFFLASTFLLLHPSLSHGFAYRTDDIAQLVKPLIPVSSDQLQALRATDPLVLPDDVRSEDVVLVTLPVVRSLMEMMLASGWGSMQLFSHPEFCRDARIFYYPASVLRDIYREFDISTMFVHEGVLRKTVWDPLEEKNLAAGTNFSMSGLLLGRCKIVILYPHPIAFHRSDPLFGFLTGNYEFFRVNTAQIDSNYDGRFALKNLRGRNLPQEGLRPVRGPVRFAMEELVLTADFRHVTVFSGLGWWTFDHPSLERHE